MSDQRVNIQNIAIHIKESGNPQGQPVFFLHGNPDSADMWDAVIAHLPDTFRCIAPDLPGYGKSAAATGFDWSVGNRGQWVADVLDALHIAEPVLLVGHDHGGPFVASFAVQFPQRVKKLVLQNTLFNTQYDWHLFGKLWRTPLLGEYLAFLQPYWITLPIAQWYMKKGSPTLSNAYIAALQKTWTHRMGAAMLALYRASDAKDFAGWEEKLNALLGHTPSLVLWGELDYYLPIRFAEGWQQHGATLIRFPDAGHWLAIEKPAAYAHHLNTFFQA
jgi:pimeloyl-ACP methyl ester carboxylesterase